MSEGYEFGCVCVLISSIIDLIVAGKIHWLLTEHEQQTVSWQPLPQEWNRGLNAVSTNQKQQVVDNW